MTTQNLKDREWLKQKYSGEGLSLADLAELCGCGPTNVLYWLRKHKIERRPQAEGSGQPKKKISKEFLLQEYWGGLKRQEDIAREVGCSATTIHNRLLEFGIPTRQKRYSISRKFLVERYRIQQKTIIEIAEEIGCVPQTIFNKLNAYDIPIWSNAETTKRAHSRGCYNGEETLRKKHLASAGANNKRWKGGRYKHYYGPNWGWQRFLARKRDGFTCQKCGATEVDLGQQLDVHHIIAFAEYGLANYEEANKLNNLTSYCKSCHTTVENFNGIISEA